MGGDLSERTLAGDYRVAAGSQIGSNVTCSEIVINGDGSILCVDKGSRSTIYSPSQGLLANRLQFNYNINGLRVPQKDQYGHQMMLPSDMIFMWDTNYRKYM